MITDYNKISGIVLSYPKNFHDEFYHGLVDFYDDLISIIPNDIDLNLVVKSESIKGKLLEQFPHKRLNFIIIPDFNEIWLRDLLGFPVNNKVIRPTFHPTYFKNIYTNSYLNKIKSQVDIIHSQLNFEVVPLDLVWDGGNLTQNNSVGFITDKILKDNTKKSETVIRKLIENTLEIKPIFVPTAEGDQLGHVDGYMNFVTDDTITLSNYPDLSFLKESKLYRTTLQTILDKEGLNTIDIWDRPYCENIKVGNESLESSRGVHNNFLQINKTLILPSYNSYNDPLIKQYQRANINSLQKYFSNIHHTTSDKLAKLGGVLHCVSWSY